MEPQDPVEQKVEEKLTFLERDLEHFRSELAETWRRLEALERRVELGLRRSETDFEGD